MAGFTDKQLEIIKYNNTIRPIITICEGAVRSGKTYVNNFLFAEHVQRFMGGGHRFIMLGYTIPSLKRNVLSDMSGWLHIPIELNKNNEFRMYGNVVSCFGADKIDSYKSMKGFTAKGMLINEATECHRNSIDQGFKRCSGEDARVFMDTNPSGPIHYIKTDYIDKSGTALSNGRIHIKSWHFSLDDNPYLPEEYREHLKRVTPSGVFYDRDILGLWVAAEGIIYRDFDYGKHVIETAPGGLKEYFAGVDWGFEHNGVIGVYGVDHDGNVFRLYEIVAQHQTIDYWKHKAFELSNNHGSVTFYCDPARPDYIAEFRKMGLHVRDAENAVVEGITCVAEQFKKSRLYIIRDGNKNYLREIYNYRWKENSAKEEPIKEDDDSMDSERYAIYSHIGKRKVLQAGKQIWR